MRLHPTNSILEFAIMSNWCYNITMENDEEVRLTLRLPPSLHKQIQQIAKGQQRSLNSQMIYMLLDWVSIQRRRTISEPVYDEAYFEAIQAMDTVDEFVVDYEKNKGDGNS